MLPWPIRSTFIPGLQFFFWFIISMFVKNGSRICNESRIHRFFFGGLPSLITINRMFLYFLNTGGKVLVLDIWQGRDSGPYMNALVFSWSAGAFLVSFICKLDFYFTFKGRLVFIPKFYMIIVPMSTLMKSI